MVTTEQFVVTMRNSHLTLCKRKSDYNVRLLLKGAFFLYNILSFGVILFCTRGTLHSTIMNGHAFSYVGTVSFYCLGECNFSSR